MRITQRQQKRNLYPIATQTYLAHIWEYLPGPPHLDRDHSPSYLLPSCANRPRQNHPGPLYQNEVKYSAFDMEMIFHSRDFSFIKSIS